MARQTKIHLDTTNCSTARMAPITKDALQDATGATPTETSVASVTAAKPQGNTVPEPSKQVPGKPSAKREHQTHGARIPTGPIMSVGQLIGGRSDAKGSVGSFDSLEDYKGYLDSLSLGELHRHALEEAKTIPIDDRGRLTRRLESEWSAVASRSPGRKGLAVPQNKGFTPEQMAKNEELLRKMLKR